jgi:membrane protease YdiL (CAAX protease family)
MTLKIDKNLALVGEGFVISLLLTIVCAFIGAVLVDQIKEIPRNSIYVMTSGIISPALAIIYLWKRTNYVPKMLSKDTALYATAGIVVMWLWLAFGFSFISGPNDLMFKKYVTTQGNYKYLGLFLLVVWAPITEEAIFRGYFQDLLTRSYSKKISLLLSTLLFILSHTILSAQQTTGTAIFSFFFFSMVAGLIYDQAGLVSAAIVHMFSNFYYCFVLAS